jgi:large subunit ribosomal protein L35
MPKLKTNRGARKRFKVTATGRILRSKAFRRHLLTTKSARRKRALRREAEVAAGDRPRIRRMLPYE